MIRYINVILYVLMFEAFTYQKKTLQLMYEVHDLFNNHRCSLACISLKQKEMFYSI